MVGGAETRRRRVRIAFNQVSTFRCEIDKLTDKIPFEHISTLFVNKRVFRSTIGFILTAEYQCPTQSRIVASFTQVTE